jgi:hypothetical protein
MKQYASTDKLMEMLKDGTYKRPVMQAIKEDIAKDAADIEEMASRFEIKSCRGKKFTNHVEESDEIDSISDSPAIAELFHFFHNCDKYDSHTPSS